MIAPVNAAASSTITGSKTAREEVLRGPAEITSAGCVGRTWQLETGSTAPSKPQPRLALRRAIWS
jgi:hypothetical protein